MPFYCDQIDSGSMVITTTGDNRTLAFMSGIATTDFKGANNPNADWVRDQMYVVLSFLNWQRVDMFTAIASPNSICQDGKEGNQGWAVDNVRSGGPPTVAELENGKIKLTIDVACRGKGSHLLRVAFHATALGIRS